LLDPAGSLPLRRHLMDLELAAAQLAVCPLDSLTGQHAARLQVTEQRLRQSRWSARDLREPGEASPAAALAAMTRAAAALDSAAALEAAPHVDKPAPPPGPLAWRIALRVTLASALAMAGGMALSPNRWFWAVITVYVVFLNTRSRGDTITKGVERMCGTLIGLAAGVALADLLRGDLRTEAAVILAAVFGLYYLYSVSYTLGIMCVTVLLGILYSLLGADMGPLLVLRLEETAIGAMAAILVAVFVMPMRTRDQVGLSGAAVLKALAAAIGACRLVLAGDAAVAPLTAMRAVDRQMADLRLAILPLTVGRSSLRRTAAERPVQALTDCVYWTRVLAVNATGPDPAAAALADRLERRVAALAAGERGVLAEPAAPAGQTALDQLDRATAALAERLAIGALHGFRLES
jgi:uncharacterized membrane protein YccC